MDIIVFKKMDICSKYAPRFDKIDKLGSLEGENPWMFIKSYI